MKSKRYGNFDVSWEFIDRLEPKLIPLFGKMIVTRAEADYAQKIIRYTAISPMFRELATGEAIPEYEIVAEQNEDDVVFKAKELLVKTTCAKNDAGVTCVQCRLVTIPRGEGNICKECQEKNLNNPDA